MTRWQAHRGSLPWAGARPTGFVQRETARGGVPHFDRVRDLHARRTPEQRAAALTDRLAELRANPPKGYPS